MASPDPSSHPGAGARPQDGRSHRLIRGRRLELAPHTTHTELEVDVLPGRPVQVGPGCELVLPVVVDDPFVAVPVAGEVIADLLGTAAHAGTVLHGMAGLEPLVAVPDAVLPKHVEGDDLSGCARTRGSLASEVRFGKVRLGVTDPIGALRHREREGRSAPVPLLRDDVDDTVGRLGAVQGSRRGPLDDLHGFDVFRVDVVQAGGRDTAVHTQTADPTAVVGVVSIHADPVDVDQGLRIQRDGAGTPNANVGATADLSSAYRHVQARHRAAQERLQVGRGRHLVELVGPDRPHHVSQRPGLLLAGGARHHQSVELHGSRIHPDYQVRGAGLHFLSPRPVPEHHHLQGDGLALDVGNEETTVGLAEHALTGSDDHDLYATQHLVRRGVHHGAAHLILGREGRRRPCERHEKRDKGSAYDAGWIPRIPAPHARRESLGHYRGHREASFWQRT